MTTRTSFPPRCFRLGSLSLLLATLASPAMGQDPFVDTVPSFSPGTSGGFGAAFLPDVVLGPPRGSGQTQGSFDVVSLGNGGSIVVGFALPVICDGPGPDLTVFENAFHSGSPSGPVFAEYGFVAVSQDGVNFVQFPHDPVTRAGLAGQSPVLSHPDNGIDPLDPAVSGGDQFDLAALGLSWAAYVRITDVNGAIADTGDLPQFNVPPSAGFDLDAVAALHACDPAALPTATPTATVPAATATPTATAAAATPTPTHTPIVTATPTLAGPAAQHDAAVFGRRPLRLRIRSGQPAATKRFRVKVQNADTAGGEVPIRLTASGCPAATVGIDFDRRVAGDQDTTLLRAGRKRAARVSATISAAAITTPDRDAPFSCTLTFAVSVEVPGNVDPQPANDTVAVELEAVDLNDVP